MGITKEQFAAYERVRRSGRYNMIMDGRAAAGAAGLTRDVYQAIIAQYKELMVRWPDVRPGVPPPEILDQALVEGGG